MTISFNPDNPSPSPVLILPLSGLGERDWSALAWRAMELGLPEEICARTGGISEKQLYQVIRQAHEHVWQNLNILSIFLDEFEEKSNRLRESLGSGPLERGTPIRHLLPDPAVSDLVLNEKEIERMIILLRSLGCIPARGFWTR